MSLPETIDGLVGAVLAGDMTALGAEHGFATLLTRTLLNAAPEMKP